MKIRIEDITADARNLAFAEPEQEINRILGEGPIREYHLEGPVEVTVSFYRAGMELFFEGKLKTRTGAVCARCAEDFDAAGDELFVKPERRHGICDEGPREIWMAQGVCGGAGKKAVSGESIDCPGAAFATGLRRTDHGSAAADEIIDNEDGGTGDIAYEKSSTHHAGAAAFFHKGAADRPAQHVLDPLTKELSPLDAARIWRGDDRWGIAKESDRTRGEQAARVEVD